MHCKHHGGAPSALQARLSTSREGRPQHPQKNQPLQLKETRSLRMRRQHQRRLPLSSSFSSMAASPLLLDAADDDDEEEEDEELRPLSTAAMRSINEPGGSGIVSLPVVSALCSISDVTERMTSASLSTETSERSRFSCKRGGHGMG